MSRNDLTLRELQTNLPWTVRYSSDFRANPQSHKDFAHALLHVHKAGGILAALVDDMDHRRQRADDPTIRDEHAKYVADLVVCALRLANTFPGGPIDLQRAVEHRIEDKNNVKLPRPDPAADVTEIKFSLDTSALTDALKEFQDLAAPVVDLTNVQGWPSPCRSCNGLGWQFWGVAGVRDCPDCDGDGRLRAEAIEAAHVEPSERYGAADAEFPVPLTV